MKKVRRPPRFDVAQFAAHVKRRLRNIEHWLSAIEAQGVCVMADAKTMNAALVALGAALDNIAADVAALKTQIGTGMSQADVDSVQASLDTIGTKAQELADSTPDA